MDYILIALLVVAWFVALDLFFGFMGLALIRFTDFHRLGVRLLSMSEFLCKYVPDLCEMSCASSDCGNWTCPYYHDSPPPSET